MTKTATKATKMVVALAEVFRVELTEATLKSYVLALSDFSEQELELAFQRAVRELKFFPKIADLRVLIGKDLDSVAYRAWTTVVDAIKRYGSYYTVKFEDSVIHMCIEDLGGWVKLGVTTVSELEDLRHEFIKLYKYYTHCPRKCRDVLYGIFDRENMKCGAPLQDPILISGEKSKSSSLDRGMKDVAGSLRNGM